MCWKCKITLSNFPIGELHIDILTGKSVIYGYFMYGVLYIGLNYDVHTVNIW